MKSSLAKFIPTQDTYQVKREAWLNDRILVVTDEQFLSLSHIQQQVLNQIGSRLYGTTIKG